MTGRPNAIITQLFDMVSAITKEKRLPPEALLIANNGGKGSEGD